MPFSLKEYEDKHLKRAIEAEHLNTFNSEEVVTAIINHPCFMDYYALLMVAKDPDRVLDRKSQSYAEFLRETIIEDLALVYGAIFMRDLRAAERFTHSRYHDEALTLSLDEVPKLYFNEGPNEPGRNI